jgi:nucleotide-binding universal stress UspA family protein
MYEKILVAVDESEAAERVLAAAEELARFSSSEVWLLHVWEGDPSVYRSAGARSSDEARSWLETAAEKLASSGIVAHAVLVANLYGYAAREITNIAVALEVGVIIMGSRGRNGVSELLAGSTARKVIHLADRPVLVVR